MVAKLGDPWNASAPTGKSFRLIEPRNPSNALARHGVEE